MNAKNLARICRPQRFQPLWTALILLGVGGFSASAAGPAAGTNTVEHRADELLRRTSDFLAQAPFFSVKAEVWQDAVLPSGQRMQAARTVDLQVRRPNRLHAEISSARHSRGIWYDGKEVTMLNRNRSLYGVVPMPNTLDEMLETATTRFGIGIPLDDLIQSNPYEVVMRNVSSGMDIGPTTVLGVPCEHLAFMQTNIDWQVWIEQGPRPVPRKIVITYKDEVGFPQYTAILSNWNFETKLPDFVFNFEAPVGATKVNVREVEPQNRNQQSEKEQ